LSIVPLHQIWVRFGDRSKSGQFAGSGGTLQRAGKNLGKGQPLQPLSEPDGVALAIRGQRQIGEAGILAGVSPSGVAVPGQVDDWKLATRAGSFVYAVEPPINFGVTVKPGCRSRIKTRHISPKSFRMTKLCSLAVIIESY
jgi:hypothetical protein